MMLGGARRHTRWRAVLDFAVPCFAALGLGALVGGCGPAQQDVRPATLVIASSPVPDAQVTVEGVSYGPAPVTIENALPGMKVVVLEKEGFRRTVKTVNVRPGERAEKQIELGRQTGTVTFESKPPHAKVYFNGDEYLGETPLYNVMLPVGRHTYEYRLENHVPVQRSVNVEEDYRYSLAHELKPMDAQLSLVSSPTGADIWINEEPMAKKTPALFSLSPGEYTVSIRAKGYLASESTVRLGANENRVLELALEPGKTPTGMVFVPAGKFLMGANKASPDERPQREVMVDAFYIDKYEVTNEEFKGVVPSHAYADGRGRYPVTGVSFNQAMEYAAAVGKRLPSEAEWEKAARGADGREYPWGNEFDRNRCNCEPTRREESTKVGEYRTGASPYGCMDMAGNVYEWTRSWYQPYPGNPDVTKDYGQIFRVLRGGSYRSSPFEVRCVRRHYDRMDVGRADYGLRCVKDLK